MRYLLAVILLAFGFSNALAQTACDTPEMIIERMAERQGAKYVKTVDDAPTVESMTAKIVEEMGKALDVPDAYMAFISPSRLMLVSIKDGCPDLVHSFPLPPHLSRSAMRAA